jgi:hypothetical protein
MKSEIVKFLFYNDDYFYGEKDVNTVYNEYMSYLDTICSNGMLSGFNSLINMHDGLIQSISIYKNKIVMTVTIGDNQIGYFECEIIYDLASLVYPKFNILKKWISDRNTELLTNEFSLNDKYIHKIELTKKRCFVIEFECLKYKLKKSKHGRMFYLLGEPVRKM